MAAERELAEILQKLEPLKDRKKRKSDDVIAKLLRSNTSKSLSAGEYCFTLRQQKPRATFSTKSLEKARQQWNSESKVTIPGEFIAYASDLCKRSQSPKPSLSIKKTEKTPTDT